MLTLNIDNQTETKFNKLLKNSMLNYRINEIKKGMRNLEFDFIISSQIQKRKVNNFLGIIEGEMVLETGIHDILEVVKITNKQFFKKNTNIILGKRIILLFSAMTMHHITQKLRPFLITNTSLIK